MDRKYINTEETAFHTYDELHKVVIKPRTFYYYYCDTCNTIKSKNFYTWEKAEDFTCRECKFSKTYKSTDKSDTQRKRLQTLKNKYGTTSTTQFIDYSKIDYKARDAKTKQTVLNRYGVDNIAKLNKTKEKAKQTSLEKYGVEYSSQSQCVKDKTKDTILEKYGSYSNLPGPKTSHLKFLQKRSLDSDTLDLDWLDKDTFRGKYDNGTIYYHLSAINVVQYLKMTFIMVCLFVKYVTLKK